MNKPFDRPLVGEPETAQQRWLREYRAGVGGAAVARRVHRPPSLRARASRVSPA